jgi:acetyl esterase/lipase
MQPRTQCGRLLRACLGLVADRSARHLWDAREPEKIPPSRLWYFIVPMAPIPFHPDLRRAARFLPSATVGERSLGLIRPLTGISGMLAKKDVSVAKVGSITVRMHQPSSIEQPLPALLWIHGGGYVLGSASQDDAICRHFSRSLGMVVASVEYRLAPKFRFPIPLHDCCEALSWLSRQAIVDSTRIAVGGASAGGGLAAALVSLARERGDVTPAFQLLAYPMIDDRTGTRTDLDESNFRLWNNKSNRFGWQSYTGLPTGSNETPDLAAPARRLDLAGLPPAWIGVGTLDLFYDEDVAYSTRLREAGVECDLKVVEGAFHGFDLVQPKAGVSREFRNSQVNALAVGLAIDRKGDDVGKDE